MSQENVAVVRKSLEGFLATGELEMSAFHDDLEIHDHDIPESGDYAGPGALERWLADWSAPWSEWSFQPKEWIDAGEVGVVVIGDIRATGRASGVKIEREDGIVYGMRDGKIDRLDYYNSRPQALAAAGLST